MDRDRFEAVVQAGFDAVDALDFEPRIDGDRVLCTVPPFRVDVELSADLYEEVEADRELRPNARRQSLLGRFDKVEDPVDLALHLRAIGR